jgi:CheY-like chemotaxis protein
MPDAKAKLLIVDDEAVIRMSLTAIFTELGYRVRSSHDGFSALVELRREMPELILSDLNMAGMSGFEFLSVVRRRFPAIPAIAMSGAFSGEGIPPGVAADAFYEKGTGPELLVRLVEAMSHPEPASHRGEAELLAPVWILRNGHDRRGALCVMVTCTECLRTFPETLGDTVEVVRATDCVYCATTIHYAIVHRAEETVAEVCQRIPGGGAPTVGVPNCGF